MADVIGVKGAFKLMKFKNNDFKIRQASLGFPGPDESTWGKSNPEIINDFFKKDTLDKELCINLGLDEEWLLPELRKSTKGGEKQRLDLEADSE